MSTIRRIPAVTRLALVLGIILTTGLLQLACSKGVEELRDLPRVDPEGAGAAPRSGTPRLVLFLVADQLTERIFERYDELWSGGFRRLRDRGLRFSEARYAHAAALTAPGHATLATGMHPSHHGIVGNWWYDPERGEEVYSVDDDEHDESPANLRATTLGDWMKRAWPQSKVFAASRKDRTAVLLAGHRGDGAFWYDGDSGDWTSSSYYGDSLPGWVESFNGRRLMDSFFGSAWNPLPVAPEVLAELGVENNDLGPLRETFPHVFGSFGLAPSEGFYSDLIDSPWPDSFLEQFAEELLVQEGLGLDEWPDLLALSFSSLDAIGHDHGPHSREALDVLLRLDRTLGQLLDFVDRFVGLDDTLIVMTSDHGVAPLPEGRAAKAAGFRRAAQEDVLCFQRTAERLEDIFGQERWFLPGLFVNPEALARSGVKREDLEAQTARLLAECPQVEKVWTRSEILAGGDREDPTFERMANSFNAERSPDFLVRFAEGFVRVRSAGTTHGTLYDYDVHVPMVFAGPNLSAGKVERPVELVSLAPTLGALLGISPQGKPDGEVLAEVVAPQQIQSFPASQ